MTIAGKTETAIRELLRKYNRSTFDDRLEQELFALVSALLAAPLPAAPEPFTPTFGTTKDVSKKSAHGKAHHGVECECEVCYPKEHIEIAGGVRAAVTARRDGHRGDEGQSNSLLDAQSAPSASFTAAPEGQEPFWMIEQVIEGVPHWWKRGDKQIGDALLPERWTTDANEARKYDSRASAEFVMGNQMPGCVATEHLMVSVAPAVCETNDADEDAGRIGAFLKAVRLAVGRGLREFAESANVLPADYAALEDGTHFGFAPWARLTLAYERIRKTVEPSPLAECEACVALKAEVERLNKAISEDSEYVQRNWASPYEKVGMETKIDNLTAQLASRDKELERLRAETAWVRRKLNIPTDTPFASGTGDTLAGTMHVVCSQSDGYLAYIAAYKCDDKQGEISRQSHTIAEQAARIAGLEAEAAAERERWAGLEKVAASANALVVQLRDVHEDPRYKAVWELHFAHGGQYMGKRYELELEQLATDLIMFASPRHSAPSPQREPVPEKPPMLLATLPCLSSPMWWLWNRFSHTWESESVCEIVSSDLIMTAADRAVSDASALERYDADLEARDAK